MKILEKETYQEDKDQPFLDEVDEWVLGSLCMDNANIKGLCMNIYRE